MIAKVKAWVIKDLKGTPPMATMVGALLLGLTAGLLLRAFAKYALGW
jgi:hypothetical protein